MKGTLGPKKGSVPFENDLETTLITEERDVLEGKWKDGPYGFLRICETTCTCTYDTRVCWLFTIS